MTRIPRGRCLSEFWCRLSDCSPLSVASITEPARHPEHAQSHYAATVSMSRSVSRAHLRVRPVAQLAQDRFTTPSVLRRLGVERCGSASPRGSLSVDLTFSFCVLEYLFILFLSVHWKKHMAFQRRYNSSTQRCNLEEPECPS